MIKYIVHTVCSESDSDGNIYRYANITSTKQKKMLTVSNVGGDENIVAKLFELGAISDWDEVYSVNSTKPVREWRRWSASAAEEPRLLESQLTMTMLRRLSRRK